MPIRELNQADLPTVLDLCQRALPLDTFSAQLIQRHMLDEPERNPAFQFGFWEGDELRGVLLGGTRRIDDGHTLLHRPRPVGVLKLIATDAGAPEDIPAWCRMTRHELVHAEGPAFWIRARS